jgi:hypothetical protein
VAGMHKELEDAFFKYLEHKQKHKDCIDFLKKICVYFEITLETPTAFHQYVKALEKADIDALFCAKTMCFAYKMKLETPNDPTQSLLDFAECIHEYWTDVDDEAKEFEEIYEEFSQRVKNIILFGGESPQKIKIEKIFICLDYSSESTKLYYDSVFGNQGRYSIKHIESDNEETIKKYVETVIKEHILHLQEIHLVSTWKSIHDSQFDKRKFLIDGSEVRLQTKFAFFFHEKKILTGSSTRKKCENCQELTDLNNFADPSIFHLVKDIEGDKGIYHTRAEWDLFIETTPFWLWYAFSKDSTASEITIEIAKKMIPAFYDGAWKEYFRWYHGKLGSQDRLVISYVHDFGDFEKINDRVQKFYNERTADDPTTQPTTQPANKLVDLRPQRS